MTFFFEQIALNLKLQYSNIIQLWLECMFVRMFEQEIWFHLVSSLGCYSTDYNRINRMKENVSSNFKKIFNIDWSFL